MVSRSISCILRMLRGSLLQVALPVMIAGGALGLAAQEILPVPALSAHVMDTTGTLSAEQKASLETKITGFEQRKGSQLVILMVPSTQPEDIASYANRVANTWKIGRSTIGDGVLLLVAKNDRQLRIEVAKTLEGAIPDLAAKRIIDQAITPAFRQNDYAGGLNAGVDQIIARVSGEALPEVAQTVNGRGGAVPPAGSLVFLLFALPIAAGLARSIFGRKLGAVVTGLGVGGLTFFFSASLWIAGIAALVGLGYAVVSGFSNWGGGRMGRGMGGLGTGIGMGSGAGWNSGGGSGGFSSGGGGDFGGGGASGRW